MCIAASCGASHRRAALICESVMDKRDNNLDTTLSIRLSTRERLQLEQLASLDDRPVTAMARHILRQALQERAA
jgi:hypothetical protein